ncbi:hypothetical protein E2P81_ATG09453 [Venturia nashicola]|uniref:Uncharacterized protein n=1 Tax=Venturia nashicola TaxID=86259 RepID=A0A4Z1P501_9PEZI|nr:hypothetical protein E6O75_ATG09662 [Venturia nashicola]TLD25796.1 hypothetical protein E2P81_ATG09453 [Venturia nashicola]
MKSGVLVDNGQHFMKHSPRIGEEKDREKDPIVPINNNTLPIEQRSATTTICEYTFTHSVAQNHNQLATAQTP